MYVHTRLCVHVCEFYACLEVIHLLLYLGALQRCLCPDAKMYKGLLDIDLAHSSTFEYAIATRD